ncbi:hypothetical protein [Tumebacillus sp. BK434]|uniref:hypothetical protein n=1 Tax=Tumebacillus sp. BK434 TaxID=2512169 RepID=UPI0014049DEC|nr:hypothetical protein [Tumebacillus sp. BK434]
MAAGLPKGERIVRFRLPVSLMLGVLAGSMSVMLNVPDMMSNAEGIGFTQSVALESEQLKSFMQRDHNLVLEQNRFYQENRDLFDNWELLQQHSELFSIYQEKLNELFQDNIQLF